MVYAALTVLRRHGLVWLIAGIAMMAGLAQADTASDAGLSGSAESVVLHVAGIENFDDYAALLNYLTRLAPIKSASPVQVFNDEVTLQLKLQGGVEQLARQFAVENRITPAVPIESTTSATTLQYRWAPPHG